jgi:hypothetical protein
LDRDGSANAVKKSGKRLENNRLPLPKCAVLQTLFSMLPG